MNRSILVAALLLGLAACAPAPQPAEESATAVILAPTADPTQPAAAPVAFIADIRKLPGRFTGTLPCASCPGIDVNLLLDAAGTYSLDETWQGDGDGEPLMSQGTWTVDASQVLLLDPDEKAGADRRFQLISNDEMQLLDGEGQGINGQQPRSLRRQSPAP